MAKTTHLALAFSRIHRFWQIGCIQFLNVLTVLMIATGVAAEPANADTFRRGNGLTLVWVTIEAYPGEGLWEACRRVYQRDVYQVRRGPGMTIRCNIDHSRIYDYGERRQNFNRRAR